MNKILGIIVVGLLLQGCVSGGVTGKTSLGDTESPMWFMTADRSDITYYYDSLSSSKLCVKWQERYPGVKLSETIRGEITDALERRGEDGLKCSDSSLDNTLIQDAKLKRALQRARDAEAAAAAAKKNKKKCRDVEIVRTDGSTYWGESCK
jgi:hypothetical protein